MTTKNAQPPVSGSIPNSSKNQQPNPNTKKETSFFKDLLDSEKDKFGDRCPSGFRKLQLLGKGGIALVWLMQVITDKFGAEYLDQNVALKQFPKTKSQPIDSSAITEIETGNIIFPLEVKEGFEGDNDDEFQRGYALDPEEYPGIKNISKLIEIIDDKSDIWLVYEVGSHSMSKVLHEVKGEFFKGERLYNIQHQQFYSSLSTSKQILVSFIRKMAQTLEVFSQLEVVHSDIKPDNILVRLTPDNFDIEELKIIDFGSAFTIEKLTNISGTTPEYLPPEILDFLSHRQAKPQLLDKV